MIMILDKFDMIIDLNCCIDNHCNGRSQSSESAEGSSDRYAAINNFSTNSFK